MNIPLEWIRVILMLLGAFGILMGALSLVFPKQSIGLYQWIMKNFNWRVEPIDYKRELRNTRALGCWLLVSSGLMVLVLFKPEIVMLVGLHG